MTAGAKILRRKGKAEKSGDHTEQSTAQYTEAQVWPALNVERWEIDRLIPMERNARTHSDEQVEQLARSLKEWGWTRPVLVAEDGTIIAGHGTVRAAKLNGFKEAPVVVARGWTPQQVHAYSLADNQLALNAGWNPELLRLELSDLQDMGQDLTLIGFDETELAAIFGSAPSAPGLTDDDEIPEAEVAVSAGGDVWELGPHRVMCGDSVDPEAVAVLLSGKRAALLHADPPYGMGKEADGVQNDNLYDAKLDAFQLEWWRCYRPHLDDNGSAYIWGNAPGLWRLWWGAGLANSEPLTLRNEIVWDKKSIAGMASPDLTQFPEATERCLFFQLGRHVFLVNQTKDDYWQGWEPIRLKLCAERDKVKLTAGQVLEICGNHMYGHWFGTSQWAFISRENWDKLAAHFKGEAFATPYEEIQAEYREAYAVFSGDIRGPRAEEFRAGRPYFDNAHAVMHDVWDFPRVTGEERFGHATPKPVAMMERIMRSSARPGGLCLEPFGGSGSTLIAAEKSGRVCYSMELDAQYVDVMVKRWQAFTGKAATLQKTGQTFEQVKQERGPVELYGTESEADAFERA